MNATQSTNGFDFKQSTTQAKAPRTPRAKARVMGDKVISDKELNAMLPSSQRVMIGTISGLLSYAGSAYWAMSMVEVISFAALTFTGSAFIGFMVWVLGAFIAVLSSMKLGYAVFKAVMDFDASHIASVGATVKHAAQRKVSLVRGWFTRSDSAQGGGDYSRNQSTTRVA